MLYLIGQKYVASTQKTTRMVRKDDEHFSRTGETKQLTCLMVSRCDMVAVVDWRIADKRFR